MDTERIKLLRGGAEKARRAGDYQTMSQLVDDATELIGSENSPLSWVLRAKLTYELHMAYWQMWLRDHLYDNLEHSLYLAQWSAAEAFNGKDPLGVLFAEMNIYGLIYPAQSKWEEALLGSKSVGDEAQMLAAMLDDRQEQRRAHGVAMNTYFHRIVILVGRPITTDPDDVERLLNAAFRNPVYLEDPSPFKETVDRAEQFLKLHT